MEWLSQRKFWSSGTHLLRQYHEGSPQRYLVERETRDLGLFQQLSGPDLHFSSPQAVAGLTGGAYCQENRDAAEEDRGGGQENGPGRTREREHEPLELCHQPESPPIA